MAAINTGLRLLVVLTIMVAMAHLTGMLVIIGRGPTRREAC